MDRSATTFTRNKVWMEQCKSIVSESMAALEVKVRENQQLLGKIAELQSHVSRLEQNQNQLQDSIKSFQREKHQKVLENGENKDSWEREKQRFKKMLEEKEQALVKVQSEKRQLQRSLQKKEQQCEQLERSLKSSERKNSQASSHIVFLKTQIENTRSKFHEHERQYEEQIQRLKDLNHEVKKQFKRIGRDYTQIIKISNQDDMFESPQLSHRPRGTKQRARIHRSGQNRPQRRHSEKRREKETANPQMGQQLLKIKQEIASQYTKLTHTKGQHLQSKVHKTLQNIDTLCSQMSYRLQEESSAYE